jgi:hypothetical protein
MLLWHFAIHIAFSGNILSPTLPAKLGTLAIQIIRGIKQLCLKGNVFELVQGDETSAFSKGTKHQI